MFTASCALFLQDPDQLSFQLRRRTQRKEVYILERERKTNTDAGCQAVLAACWAALCCCCLLDSLD
ncbi:rCG49325, isoform CRA_c [Rattus norvegicus]|uniref:RCG49325, isoform CRA_c n=1 Tax=Rattus norvegicus TaxID=10116 RepID=A6J310_RAT|nr:rCG49325, isoform CRA_c [Rattus norvegicus]